MAVLVVGSCWWCDQSSAMARHIHMLLMVRSTVCHGSPYSHAIDGAINRLSWSAISTCCWWCDQRSVCHGKPYSHSIDDAINRLSWLAIFTCCTVCQSARLHIIWSVVTITVRNLFRIVQCSLHRSPPWRLLLAPICGDVLGWVRILPTPASRMSQSMHPSIGPQGWHLASLNLPVVRLTGLYSAWRHFILCGAVQNAPVIFHGFPY